METVQPMQHVQSGGEGSWAAHIVGAGVATSHNEGGAPAYVEFFPQVCGHGGMQSPQSTAPGSVAMAAWKLDSPELEGNRQLNKGCKSNSIMGLLPCPIML